jgi:hypothetical protein
MARRRRRRLDLALAGLLGAMMMLPILGILSSESLSGWASHC